MWCAEYEGIKGAGVRPGSPVETFVAVSWRSIAGDGGRADLFRAGRCCRDDYGGVGGVQRLEGDVGELVPKLRRIADSVSPDMTIGLGVRVKTPGERMWGACGAGAASAGGR